MKQLLCSVLLLAGLGLCHVHAAASGTLKWSDEFNQAVGSKPDASKWTYDLGSGGWGNNELETYTSDAANASIVYDPDATDGKALAITAIKTSSGYTSARIKTQGLFSTTRGRIEARLKLPRGKGIWPAFWMLGDNIATAGWPACGELDIMENLGHEIGKIYGTLHGSGYDIGGNFTFSGVDPSYLYYTYSIQWSPGIVRWFINGYNYCTVKQSQLASGQTWAFDLPEFIILNLAVGGNWPGNPDSTTVFPQTYYVDYVRVYEDGPAAPATVGALAQGDGSVRVSWSPAAEDGGSAVKAYKVERATKADFSTGLTSFDAGTGTAYRDVGVAAGTTYYYRVTVTNTDGASSAASDPVSVLAQAAQSAGGSGVRFTNVSSRCRVGKGDDVAIVGFSVNGTGTAKVLVRVVGPTLGIFGVSGVIEHPVLTVYDANSKPIAVNLGWTSGGQTADLKSAFDAVGAFGLSETTVTDCALLITLPPGNYTAIASGAQDSTGVAIVEAYLVP
jgi:beta-glucanase (GH16 family)